VTADEHEVDVVGGVERCAGDDVNRVRAGRGRPDRDAGRQTREDDAIIVVPHGQAVVIISRRIGGRRVDVAGLGGERRDANGDAGARRRRIADVTVAVVDRTADAAADVTRKRQRGREAEQHGESDCEV
jgi:hypothetical protein